MNLVTPIINGFLIGLGLIAAIGMQNAFILKQGILKNHVIVIVLVCSLLDAIMITAGINGMGIILSNSRLLLEIFNWGGIVFLFIYGTRSFIASFKQHSLEINNRAKLLSLKQVVIRVLAVTLLNPHTYLDSFVLMGSLATNFKGTSRTMFNIGAVIASFVWFFSLGFGARLLSKVFRDYRAWRTLDFLVGCSMYAIAVSLIFNTI